MLSCFLITSDLGSGTHRVERGSEHMLAALEVKDCDRGDGDGAGEGMQDPPSLHLSFITAIFLHDLPKHLSSAWEKKSQILLMV